MGSFHLYLCNLAINHGKSPGTKALPGRKMEKHMPTVPGGAEFTGIAKRNVFGMLATRLNWVFDRRSEKISDRIEQMTSVSHLFWLDVYSID